MIDSHSYFKLYSDVDALTTKEDEINWEYLHWLNTPGPIFTGYTDNLGTGQPTALNHVIGDYDYHEAIFRQPKSQADFKSILLAALYEPCEGYSFVGAKFWTLEKIKFWWSHIEDIASHIKIMRDRELSFGSGDPHKSLWNLGGEIKELHLYGPMSAIPENYQNWLTYYQSGELENDVQRFAYFIDNKRFPNQDAKLPDFKHIRQQKVDPEMISTTKLFP